MKYLKLGLDVFLKKMALGLLLILQLTVSIGLMNVLLATVNTQRMTQRLFEPFAAERGAYVMPSPEYRWNSSEGTAYQPKHLNRLKKLKKTVQIKQFSFDAGGFQNLNCFAYDDFVMERFAVPLIKGSSLKSREPGAIPVYISNETPELHYGDTVEISMISFKDGTRSRPVRCYIAGVLHPAKYHLQFSASGGITYHHLIKSYDSEYYNNEPFFIASQNDMASYQPEQYTVHSNFMAVFEPDITPQEYQENMELLSKDCMTLSFDELYQAGKAETQETVRGMLPMVLCAFAISVIGILSFIVLHTLTQMKNFAIYYICGCRWRNCIAICCGFLFWVFLPTVLLLAAGYFAAGFVSLPDGIYPLFTLNNLWLTLGAFLVCFLSAILPPWVILKRTQPVELFHNEN